MRLLSKLLVLLVLLTLGSISAQAQNTCTYFGGYPWRKGGCLVAEDLNIAMAQALGPPTTLSTVVVQNALTPGGVTLPMLAFTPLLAGNNLSDLNSIATARATLGLGGMALQNPNAVAITGGTITGLGSPAVASDAATKGYVDSTATGLQPNALGADYATAATLPNSPTYSNGTAGVGATFTANVSNSALVVDGQVGANTLGKRILVKNQATLAQNGVYQVTQIADATHPWILTRVTDFDAPSEMAPNTYFFVAAGTGGTNAATGWTSGPRPTAVGTDPITFTQFSAAQTYAASGGIQLIGNTFSLVNQSMTLAGHVVNLGGTQTFSASDLTDGVSGTGAIAKVTSPAFTTPDIGAATAASLALSSASYPVVTITSTFPGTVASDLAKVVINIGSYPDAGLIPAGVVEGFRSAIVVPVTYTQAPWPITNFSGYCDNKNTAATGNSCVPFFSVGLADGGVQTTAYGQNGVLSNTDTAHIFSGATFGKDFGALFGNECNPNIWTKAAGATPSGSIKCFEAIGGGNIMPSGLAVGYHVSAFAAGIPWTWGFQTADAAAGTGIELGAVGTGVTQPSQGITLIAHNTAGSSVTTTTQAVPNGTTANFNWGVPAAGQFQWLVNSAAQYTLDGTGFFGASVALGTGATGPFIYVNTMAGIPSGVPTDASAGRAALAIDTTNHKICWYEQIGAVWKCALGS